MANREIWKLIKYNVTGTIRPHERLLLDRWMNQHPDNRKLLAEVEKSWARIQEKSTEIDVDQAWQEFLRKRGELQQPEAYQKKEKLPLYPAFGRIDWKSSSGSVHYLLRIAAILLIGALIGLFAYRFSVYMAPDTHELQLVMEELVTKNGEKARVTFSDGTQVILNSASSLNFPRRFHDANRVVYLEGEAYFKVVPNSAYPFIVRTQGVDVEVLGTEFNVRGWEHDPEVKVIVREGKVSVEATDPHLQGQKSVILTAGLQTSVNRGEVPMEPWEVDIKNKLVWLNGGLHFENTPFRFVVKDLERRFNVEINVEDDSLLDLLFTSTFQYADLHEILDVITGAMEIDYRHEGSVVTFP
jgi:transmembrane sensor